MTSTGALYGRGLSDSAQYSALDFVTLLLRRIARAMDHEVSPAGVWAAIVTAGSCTTPDPTIVGDYNARRIWR
jgi:hypothetical protein